MTERTDKEILAAFASWQADIKGLSDRMERMQDAMADPKYSEPEKVAFVFSYLPTLYATLKVREEEFRDVCVQAGVLTREVKWEVQI